MERRSNRAGSCGLSLFGIVFYILLSIQKAITFVKCKNGGEVIGLGNTT
ncbi:hypothetical protein [Leptospira weilii]|nr:hypothetical protein [Leptospira weilii]